MRRIALALSFLSLIAGLGCHHVAGRCDCYHEASNGDMAAGTGGQPYQTLGTIAGPAVPEKLGAPEKAK